MSEDSTQLSKEPFRAVYRIVLAQDNVRFLKLKRFLEKDADVWIEMISGLAPEPTIIPLNSPSWKGLDLEAIDALCPRQSWDTKLRIHHALGKLYLQHDAPTYAYSSFHVGLMLTDYNYEEFIRAWEMETLGNCRLKESLKQSTGHVELVRAPGSLRYIFRKTPFVLDRLAVVSRWIEQRDQEFTHQAKQRAEEVERLESQRRKEAKREAEQRAEEVKRLENRRREEAALRAAEESAQRKQLSERRPTSEPAYVVTIGPGVVRFLGYSCLLDTDAVHWIDLIQRACLEPRIESPPQLDVVDEMLPDLCWQDRLRTHFVVGRLSRDHGVPLLVPSCFLSELGLTAISIDECVNAWVREAWGDSHVEESYVGSLDHLILPRDALPSDARCVFRKTPFIIERLAALAQQAELQANRNFQTEIAARAAEDRERLLKSSFSTFIYVMEDLRNGSFKIGRSKTPRKRERTLQSEVPQIVMRLSIPAGEEHERELHEHFSASRIRGEWFSLGPDDLRWLVSFVKRNCDCDRAHIDFEWFGSVLFTDPNKKV